MVMHHVDDPDSGEDQCHLLKGRTEGRLLVETRNEVCHGNIDKAGCRNGKNEGEFIADQAKPKIGKDPADHGGKARKKVIGEGAHPAVATLEQNRKVADFLRDFMGGNRQAGHDSELDIGQEGCGDQDAIDKVVNGIADHDQGTGGLVEMGFAMGLAVGGVAMPPDQKLFKQEKSEDAGQNGPKDQVFSPGAHLVHGIGEKIKEGHAQEGAERKTDSVWKDLGVMVFRYQKKAGCKQHTQEAADEGKADDEKKGGHSGRFLFAPDEAGHAAGCAITPVGEKRIGFKVGTTSTAINGIVRDACLRQKATCQFIKIGMVAVFVRIGKRLARIGVSIQEGVPNFRADFKGLWADGRSEPGENLMGSKRCQGGLKDAARKPLPAGMGGGNALAVSGGKKDGKAVGRHDDTGDADLIGKAGICGFEIVGVGFDAGRPVDLIQPGRGFRKPKMSREQRTVFMDLVGIIPYMGAKVESLIRSLTAAGPSKGAQRANPGGAGHSGVRA